MPGNVFDTSIDWYLKSKKQLEEAEKTNNATLRLQAQSDMNEALRLLKQDLQQNKKDINSVGRDGKLPVQKAIWTKDENIVKAFVEAGADVRAKDGAGNTVLHTAAYSGTPEIVSVMLNTEAYKDINKENDNGKTPLSLVNGETKADDKKRSMLLQYGAEGHASNLDATIEHAFSNATGQHKEAGMNALKNMVNAGTLNGEYLFNHLAKEKDSEVFKQKLNILKEAGLDLNTQDAKSGDTLLHRIAGSANKEMILAAKEAGIDAGVTNNNGETPDHVAARSGNMAASTALGSWKINEPDNKGRTPIMIAAEKGDVDQFNQLLALGADPAKRDDNGMSSLTITKNKDIAIKCIQEGVTNRRFQGNKNDGDSFGQTVDYYMHENYHMTYQEVYNEAVRDAASREDVTALKKMAHADDKAEAGMMEEFVKTEKNNYKEGTTTGIALQVLSKNGIYEGADQFEIEDQNLHLANYIEKGASSIAAAADAPAPAADAPAPVAQEDPQDINKTIEDFNNFANKAIAESNASAEKVENLEKIMQEEEHRRAVAAMEAKKEKITVHGYSKEAYVHAQTRLDGLVKKDAKMAKTVNGLRKNYKEMEEKGLLPKGENGQSNADIYAYKMCMANSLVHPEEKVKDSNTGKKISFKEQVGGNHRDVVRRISDGKPLTEEEKISIARTTLGVEQQISDKGQLIANNGVKGMSYNTKAVAGHTVKLEEIIDNGLTSDNKTMLAQNDAQEKGKSAAEEKQGGEEQAVLPPKTPKLRDTNDSQLTLSSDGKLALSNSGSQLTLNNTIKFDEKENNNTLIRLALNNDGRGGIC